MPPEKSKEEKLAQWYEKADGDLGVAEHLLKDGLFLVAVGFHSQQAAEKYLKAFLTWHDVDFPKTHDIGYLLDLVSKIDNSLATSLYDVNALTDFAVETRYPTDVPEISSGEAEEAVRLAILTRDAVKAAIEKAY